MKKTILILLVVLSAKISFAQQAKDLQTPCATSNQGTAGNFVISYTIGEMVLVSSNKNNGLFVTNGIYQPIVPTNPVDGQVFLDGEITVFPNPTPNILSIQYNILQAGKMTVQVFDATGKKLIVDEILVNSFSTKKYDISQYASGMYVLLLQYVSNDGATIKKGKYKIMRMPKG
jgi:Secretion system C-terminal sorting domain